MTIRTLTIRSYEQLRCIPRQFTYHRTPLHPRISPIQIRTFHVVGGRRGEFDPRTIIARESDEVDVCIVGGGPSGLSAAIRLKQLAEKGGREIRVLLLEKGGEMGTQCVFPW